MSLRFRILFSSACAVLAALLCAVCADSARAEAERARNEALERYGGEVVSLVVADEALEAGDVVTASNVSERDWVSDLAPADAITSMDDAVGRELTVPVSSGAPLTGLNFRDTSAMADIPSGHVAVSVPVTDRLGLGTGVEVGSRVVAYEAGESSSQLVADDVTVLTPPEGDGSMSRGSVTIAVLPEDVSEVLSASASGNLRLVQPADDVAGVATDDVAAPSEVAPEDSDEGEGEAA